MKRFVVNIFIFFGIVAICDISSGFVCKYMIGNAHSGDFAKSNGVLKQNHYDLMMMGSSRCVCHYDDCLLSDSLGISAINAGNKGNGIVLFYGCYHIIPKNKLPKVLLYDIEPDFDLLEYDKDDNNRRYLKSLKMYYDEPGIPEIFNRVDNKESLKMMSQLYRYNSEWFTIINDFFRKNEIKYSYYQPTRRAYTASMVKDHNSRKKDDLKLFYLEQLMKETKQDGVQLVVIASPKYGTSTTEGLETVVELCQRHSVPFWNYYLDMHDTKWFCDNMHLNYEGSQEYTKTILQRIIEEKLIK